MTIQKEVSNINNFEFWGPAVNAVRRLSYQEKQDLWDMLEELYYDTIPTETEINDFVSYNRETWTQWLGITEEELFDRELPE